MIVADLADQLGLKRLPFHGAPGAPAAEATGRLAGKAGRADERLDNAFQLLPLLGGETGTEADMVEQALLVVEAKQKRADLISLFRVAEAAYNAVSGANAFHFHHGGAVARVVRLAD